ncbi:sulfatase-like hydrolase/transferase [Membranicola marinus]|uniref:Sulfatase-like hydrolase/transferase n=1 Tax=Membranihabitans marinus TaxID=1227546 RepID=A0A953HV66_9BACT|nr:sulfatase-like hydrolase/transferase [Membranihabitans marinus]MBY5958870.1 sulfatase-like hydrolase/transferase [Membranihabitans marinus]
MKYILIFSLFVWFNWLSSAQAQTEGTQPNILWIVSEDNSPFIGAYGDKFATTPHIDQLAREGVLYENAFASAPVCAPSRSTLITGVYPVSMGTQHMRSTYPIPDMIEFYPRYLREAGYYTTNNSKKDYNTDDQSKTWDESSNKATYLNRKEGQPFFAIFNIGISHESSIHDSIPIEDLRHDPEAVPIPPYHPRTSAMKHDWAQYYDKMEDMDARVGAILADLEASGEADNTIVFYYSDHGGILGRSKRFLFESGLRIPLVIRFPEKYKNLAPGASGSRTDRLVSFIDFPPTILSLAGLSVPDYMQGTAFLGKQKGRDEEYAFGFRGRMDERIDMSRTARDKQYRYTRNFMPHKVYGQYLEYLWRAPSMKSWADAYDHGTLNETQSRFFEPKEIEELYDITNDPDNINNLADDPAYKEVLDRMSQATMDWMIRIKDVGLIPEAMVERITEHTTMYEYARSGQYPIEQLLPQVERMTKGDQPAIRKGLKNKNPILRYWAATSAAMYPEMSAVLVHDIQALAQDDEVTVQIAAAEALYRMGQTTLPQDILIRALKNKYEKVRFQALNVLFNFEEKDLEPVWTAIRQIVPADPKNRKYDVRAARGLLKKYGAG